MTFFPLLNYVPISVEQSVLSAGCWINVECNAIPDITTEMGIFKAHIMEVVVEVCASCVSGEHWEQLMAHHGRFGDFQLGSPPTGLRRECDDFWI